MCESPGATIPLSFTQSGGTVSECGMGDTQDTCEGGGKKRAGYAWDAVSRTCSRHITFYPDWGNATARPFPTQDRARYTAQLAAHAAE